MTGADEATAADSGRAADPWSRFWGSKESLDTIYPSSPRVVQAVRAHLEKDGARILEIGAGTGRDTAALAAAGHRAVALDAAPEALALTARAAPALVGRGIVRGDAFHLPFADGVFDAVFHQGVLEHFGNPRAFLDENLRVTAPGGLLVVDVPQRWHAWTALKRAAIRVDRWFAGWETDFTVDELSRLIEETGYRVEGAYADTMVPSLGYRLAREAAGRAGLRLPMRPAGPAPLRRLRAGARERFLGSRAGRSLAHTIGVVARRPAE
ncbi:MAG TPA: class I SAM-dependent methyltransferase [Gemmatimonadota bacterium]|nr:class I SAM-dependent methyltransferase [Gemmatimonadota bacterium]